MPRLTVDSAPRWLRLGIATLASCTIVVAFAPIALAHDPLVITADQQEPEEGPRLPDGTISFALYGTLKGEKDTRGFLFNLQSGDRLNISLLIPDQEPEKLLATADLPRLALSRPDGSELEANSTLRIPFSEPFSMTQYIRVFELSEQGMEGRYSVKVLGSIPSRFTVAIGYVERFGTPVDNALNRAGGIEAVANWYKTPPSIAPRQAEPTPSPSDDSPTGSDGHFRLLAWGGAVGAGIVVWVRLNHRRRSSRQAT